MRVLDLGCGRAASSIFLHREFGVQVWATHLWFTASENHQRIRDAGINDGVFPIHADARSLPFAGAFFDAIVCVDSFMYYGTDDLYLGSLARYVKPGGPIGIAGAGLMREFDGEVPDHLRAWWTGDLWCLHSSDWWRRHWERTGIVEILLADTMPDGWQSWLEWHTTAFPREPPPRDRGGRGRPRTNASATSDSSADAGTTLATPGAHPIDPRPVHQASPTSPATFSGLTPSGSQPVPTDPRQPSQPHQQP